MAAPISNPVSWPISRPLDRLASRASSLRWAMACGLLVLPLTAILHHAVFYPASCMLNEFGADYSALVVAKWLSRDPSPWLAMLIAFAAFQLGGRFAGLRFLVLPFAIAFLPLALWIWDIPFSGRIVCEYLHDGRAMLAEGLPLKGRYLYLLGGALYAAHVAKLGWRRHGARSRRSLPPSEPSSLPAHWDGAGVHPAA